MSKLWYNKGVALQASVVFMLLVVLVLYITSRNQPSAPTNVVITDWTENQQGSASRLVPGRSIQLFKPASANLYKVKSGKSTIFIDDEGAITIPPPEVIKTLNLSEMEELFFRYIESIQARCVRMVHVGNEQDGGYHVCETHVDIDPNSCLTYSFGIRKDFSFDDGVANVFGCDVYSFDPGDGQKDHKHSNKVTFYSIGIGGQDGTVNNWKIMTFGSIRKMLGHIDRTIDIVKIDTEGAEWDSLDTMIKTGDINNIRLLIIEFHEWINPGNNKDLKNVRTTLNFGRWLTTMHGLYAAGFRIYFFRMWPFCRYKDDKGFTRTACHEVHFYKL